MSNENFALEGKHNGTLPARKHLRPYFTPMSFQPHDVSVSPDFGVPCQALSWTGPVGLRNGAQREEVAPEWRKLRNEELH